MQPISDPRDSASDTGAGSGTGTPGPALRARTFVCMGTVVSLTVPVGGCSPTQGSPIPGSPTPGSPTQGSAIQAEVDRLEAATAVVEDHFEALDAQFSLYKPMSEASRVARGDLSLMQASPLMRDLYADAVRWRRRTDGAFTPERPDGLLDLSGLVKGYAIAEAGRSLAALGLHDWCLNAGGDVLVSGGPRAGGGTSAWLAGIVDPADRRTLLGAYPLGGGRAAGRSGGTGAGSSRRLALATSGSAERGDHIWTVGMRRPAGAGAGAGAVAGAGPTQAMRPEFAQVSVAAPDIVTADVLATAVVAGGHATLNAVTSRWDVDVLAVTHDGALLATPGFRAPSAA